jgi:hypothetical protein
VDQLPGEGDQQQQRGGDDEVHHPLVDRVVEVVAEEALDVGESVGAAGGGLLADQPDREGRGERLAEDREVRALHPAAEDEGAEDRGDGHRQQHGRGDGEERVLERPPPPREFGGRAVQLHEVGKVAGTGVGDLQVHRHRVAAEPEEHALPEREQSAAAPGQADADGDDRGAQVLGEQPEPEVRERQRGDGEQGERG